MSRSFYNKSMKNLFCVILAAFFCAASGFSQSFYSELVPEVGECVAYVAACDWGACVEKIVICTEKAYEPGQIRARDFDVHKVVYSNETNFGINNGKLDLTDAYTSDSNGNRIDTASHFIAILTVVHPETEDSNPFVAKNFGGGIRPWYGYRLENDELDFKIKKFKGFVNYERSLFSESEYEYTFPPSAQESKSKKKKKEPKPQKVTMNYAYYIPEGKKLPLILWFHGMGESGYEINKVLFGTKITAFATKKIQNHFESGVAILAPQCPSGWLETTEVGKGGVRVWEPFDKDAVTKPVKNFFGKVFELDNGVAGNSESDDTSKLAEPVEPTPYAAVSYYTEPVLALLEDFLEAHPQIDRDRIYVGGCSAGGYMTVNMMIQAPGLFAAAFPVCEYYLDSKITNAQVAALSQKPLWFTYAQNDETVKPEKCSIATIGRLKMAGAKNLHVSEFERVVDTSGLIPLDPDADEDEKEYGLPYEYDGHYSWIYVLNDECFDGELNLFDWLAAQKRQ